MAQMEGRIAVVSGLQSVLRDALAQRLRDEGATVTVVEPGAAGVTAAGEAAGRIDALVNVLKPHDRVERFVDSAPGAMDDMLGQVRDFALGMRAAWPFLPKGADARVVNVCGSQGATTNDHFADTVTADFALQGLTRALGVEWAHHNVLVNCLVPGMVDLPEVERYRDAHPDLFAKRLANVALQRLGDPYADVGGALLFLLSDEACFIVGQAVYADGGQHLSTAVYDPGGYAVTTHF